ncbi:MAG: GGDEF domain-containing phosphodiesterase [Clostridia bacterium]
MKNLFLVEIDSGGAILLLLLLIILTVGAGVFLFFSIKREIIRYHDATSKKRIFAKKEEMDESINSSINVANTRTKFYLFRVDINGYDSIVKSYGDEQCKILIHTAMSILDGQLPIGVRICRYADDQIFIVMRESLSFNVEKYSAIMVELMTRPIKLDNGLSVEMDVNVGVVAFPEGGKTLDELLQSLDVATVTAKRMGVNKSAIYSHTLSEKAQTKEYEFYNEVKAAMARKEFTLHYQPIINIDTEEVCGAECLIRWEHATKGLILPSKFLPIMERTGDINWVGLWSFEQMVRQLVEWQNRYEQRFWLSINMSVRQIANPDLVTEFKRILKKHHAEAKDFCIEIFDIAMYEKSEAFKETIDKLIQAGFMVAIDKYGRDFNGLTQLEKLPITQIKLDNVFLEHSKESSMTESVVSAVIEYCVKKNINLIADGVETFEDLQYAKEKGIHIVQGYYYSKPKEKKEFIGEVLLTPWKA